MVNPHHEYEKQLETISSITNYFLQNKNGNEEIIGFIEKWLTAILNRIRVKKLESLYVSGATETEYSMRKDGLLTINSDSQIFRHPGFLNHFNGLPYSNDQPIKLIDLLADSNKQIFEEALQQALAEKRNIEIDVSLNTGAGKMNKCSLEIDILSSNLANDRILIYYSFYDIFNIQDFDFQSIVFDSLPGMDVFLFDREYRYILSGGNEKKKMKMSNADFIGKRFFDVFDKEGQRRFFPFYNKAINGEYTEGEARYKNEVYYIAAAPIKNNKNETVAGIVISQNVTKDKQLEENLIKSKEQAQQADKAKSLFLANMSHEIRTPLNSIIGFSEQLRKTQLSNQQEKFVSLITNASDHLLYLVNEIVFLFKLGMDKVYIEKTPFSIKNLLSEINDILKKQATEKNLIFRLEIEDKLPDMLKGDPFRLKQILMNLLVNALKYSEHGEIKLRCKLISENKKTAKILFEVSDTGIGISQKDLPFIFDVFEQGNIRTEKIRGGAGLGLGICKKLVTLFKGDIEVESKLNKGSKFSVTIPLEKLNEDIVEEKTELKYNLSDKFLQNKKVLLADDDTHNLLLAEMILKAWNTDYTLVDNGEKAIKAIQNQKFDLLLLDIHMPLKNGVQVIKKTRSVQEGPNRSTPAVALTANALKTDINHYLKVGFNDYVIKPFKEADLYNKLCNILQIEPTTSTKNTSKNKNMDTNLPADTFNVADLKKTANGDAEFFNMMIDNFTTNAKALTEVFEEGLAKEDWTEIGEKAHKAIPAFKFFKLNAISSRLGEIEDLALRDKNFDELPTIIDNTKTAIAEIIEQAEKAKADNVDND